MIGAKVKDGKYRSATTVFRFKVQYDHFCERLDKKLNADKKVDIMQSHRMINDKGRVWTFA
jgi:hypothetical protein